MTGREQGSLPQMGEATWLLSTPNKTTHKPHKCAMPPPSSPVLEHMEQPDILVPDMPLTQTKKPKNLGAYWATLYVEPQNSGRPLLDSAVRSTSLMWLESVEEIWSVSYKAAETRATTEQTVSLRWQHISAVIRRSSWTSYSASRNATREATVAATTFPQ